MSCLVRVADVEVMFPSSNKRYVTVCLMFGSGALSSRHFQDVTKGFQELTFKKLACSFVLRMQNDDGNLNPGFQTVLIFAVLRQSVGKPQTHIQTDHRALWHQSPNILRTDQNGIETSRTPFMSMTETCQEVVFTPSRRRIDHKPANHSMLVSHLFPYTERWVWRVRSAGTNGE
jgi:hypothetical protein